MGKKILLTGNNGYIGPVMTRILKEQSHTVTGLDTGYYKGCELFNPETDPDRQIIKDIRDLNENDLEGIEAVIHLSALSNDPLGELNPSLTDNINTKASVKLAEIAKKAGVERFIFASSCSVYGIASDDKPITEESPVNPLTAYAKAKYDVEQRVSKLADKDFHPVFMRNATVYGLSPRLRLDLVVNNLTAWAYFTGKVAIMSDGMPWRPIIHISDFCRASASAVIAKHENVHNQIINVGRDFENYKVKEIADKVQKVVPGSKVEILNKTGSDERSYRVDFSKIKKVLPEFKPCFDVDKGIVELYEAFKKYKMTNDDMNGVKYFRVKWIKQLIEQKKLDLELKWTK
ncbi:MAG: NAD(P)-dependent oxidoreductase [Elusimicrobiota bacterium]